MTAGVLGELGALHMTRPGLGASDTEVAAWYERKAAMLEQVAAEGGPGAERAAGWAVSAHEHADRLISSHPPLGTTYAARQVMAAGRAA